MNSKYKIDQYYEVTCAQLRWKEDGRIYEMPVLDHFHADPQFGFPHLHYHIDGRFKMHPRMRHHFKVKDGVTLMVIVDLPDTLYEFQGIVKRRLLCESVMTGLAVGEIKAGPNGSLQKYRAWYAGFVGQVCAGKRCPHFGTEMLEQDGLLVCPMHQLTAYAATGRIIALDSYKQLNRH